MHKHKRFPLLLFFSIAVVVFLIGVGIFIFLSKVPAGTDLIPQGRSTVQVNMVGPVSESAWPLDAYIPVKAAIYSKSPIDTVKLFVNGELYDTRVFPQGEDHTEYSAEWSWQPGTTGRFYLMVYATSREGGAGTSQALVLTAVPSSGTRQLVNAEGGETLTKLAEANDIPIASIENANPGVDPQMELQPGSEIFLPNPPIKITNPHIIQGIPIDLSMFEPGAGSGQTGNPPANPEDFPDLELVSAQWTPLEDGDPPAPQELIRLPDKLGIYFKSDQDKASDEAPYQPKARVNLVTNTKCDVKIIGSGTFGNNDYSGYEYTIPKREDGFYIYRSRDGGALERIATLPPNMGSGSTGNDPWIELVDPAQYGFVTYTISAFNGAGETFSEPVSLPLEAVGCKNQHALSNPFQPMLVGDELIMPYFKSDMAYFYIQINDSAGMRAPEGNRTFLSGSGGKFNIRNYLETIIDQFPQADLNLKMEIWVWDGGKLKHLGNFETNYHRSVLQVCSIPGVGSCSGGGGGSWVTDVNLDNGIPLKEQVYEMRWASSNLVTTRDIKLAVAAKPYTSNSFESSPAVLSKYSVTGKYPGTHEGVFTYEIGSSLYPDSDKHGMEYLPNSTDYDYITNYFRYDYPLGTPFTIYARILAISDLSGFHKVSNTITMRYQTPPVPDTAPPLSSPYISLFDVEIVENTYIMPNLPNWNDWGCVVIDADPTNTYDVNSTQCPGKVNQAPADDCGWNPLCYYSAMFTPMGSAWDYAVKIFNDAKAGIVGAIASAIPGCSGNTACEGALSAALDYGIAALTGIPPLPSSDEIVSGQINAYIDSQLSGLPVGDYICNDECKKLTSQKITEQLIKARTIASQTACLDVIEAYHHNQYNNCLDPSIQVHPAKGAMYNPGMVMVKVTRKDTPETNAIQQSDSGNYRLYLSATGENSNRKGYWGYNCEYRDNIAQAQLPDPTDLTDLANFDYFGFTKDKEQGNLYYPQYANIPWLQPGESVTMPIKLDTVTQWMGTDDQLSCVNNVDFRYLFYRGITHMKAAEYCLSPGSSQAWVPCTNGGTDVWDFANPEVP